MNRPPMIMRLRIPHKNGTIRLWIPFFLVYPILAILALLIAPLVLVAALILWPWGWSRTLLLSGPYLCRVIYSLRGLEVDVGQKDERILVSFK